MLYFILSPLQGAGAASLDGASRCISQGLFCIPICCSLSPRHGSEFLPAPLTGLLAQNHFAFFES